MTQVRFMNTYKNIGLDELINSTEGYFFLELSTSNNTGKKLDVCKIESETYYILGGTYFSPYIYNLVQDSHVNGIQLDTTWSILQQYVTSIPTIIISGVGIPIGFQFGLVEDIPIYINFFEKFEETFGFKINDYITIAQSDQGGPLISAVSDLGMDHIFCLRQVLVSLKTSKFSSQIGKLVSAVSEKDLNDLMSQYNEAWKDLNEDDLGDLRKYLSKVGLTYTDNQLKILDPYKWESCSMQKRVAFKMPSCTNQIESFHGHLNATIPRRNSFYSSIKRLIDEIIQRTDNFFTNFQQNYKRYQRKIKNIIKSTPDEIIALLIHDYETKIDDQTCKCGESILISSTLDAHIPCSHLYHLGDKFPDIDPPEITLKNTFQDHLVFEYDINTIAQVHIDMDYYTKIRNYAYRTIKRYSHSKSKNEINEFVQSRLKFDENPEKFILGNPAKVFSVIDEGIRFFYRAKKDKNPIL